MSDRVPSAHARSTRRSDGGDQPPPEIVDFIRYCHRRRGVGWPEIYDEMCAVASRREFNGWDHADLSQRGVTFSLLDTPRLASWVRLALTPAEARQRNAPPV